MKFIVDVAVPFVALTLAVVAPVGVPPVLPPPPPPELLPLPLHAAKLNTVANSIAQRAVTQERWRRVSKNAIMANAAARTTDSRAMEYPSEGLGHFEIGIEPVAAVFTVTVMVCDGFAGVSVTDAGLVAGFVAKVQVASEGNTGHWNPLTVIEPDVRFTAVAVRVRVPEFPFVTETEGVGAVR